MDKFSVRVTITGLDQESAALLSRAYQEMIADAQYSDDNPEGFRHTGAQVTWGRDNTTLDEPDV